jgi:hypothetical protein
MAFRELKLGVPQMGVPRSKRAMLLLEDSRQQLRKQWAEMSPAPPPEMIETPIAGTPSPAEEPAAADVPKVRPRRLHTAMQQVANRNVRVFGTARQKVAP